MILAGNETTRGGLYGVGQESEQICARYLSGIGYTVIPISEYTNNTGKKINAPMLLSPEGLRVSPDLLVMAARKSFWVEVKRKGEPTYYWKRSRWEHGVDTPNFEDYMEIQRTSGYPVYIFVHEIKSPATPDLYLNNREDIGARRKMIADLQDKEVWLSIAIDNASKLGESRPNNREMIRPQNPMGTVLIGQEAQ